MTQNNQQANSASEKSNNQGYATIWRWHFYAGSFIAPFLIVLAVTGLGMMLFANIDGADRERTQVIVPENAVVQPISEQAQSAVTALPNGELTKYIAPKFDDTVAIFQIKNGEEDNYVSINPYTAEVVEVYPTKGDLYHLMDDIHGTLLLDKTGDFFIETSASLAILMIVSGWYLWWLRQKSMKKSLLPKLRNVTNKKLWWRNAHGATGAWVSVVLFCFLLSGLAWAGIWGGKFVQPWNQFPAEKGKGKPKSTLVTHGEVLNNGNSKEIAWGLELTPMPVSDPKNKAKQNMDYSPSMLQNLDKINQYARDNGFVGRYKLNFPKGETGVWTLTQSSMSSDSQNPMADRTVHLDQYSGEKLADIRFADYNIIAKAMAVGIALHMGTLGWWSILANVLFCLAVIFMCIGGYVMWWKRRPSQVVGLNPPPSQKNSIKSVGIGFFALLIILAILFPTAILAIVVIAVLDFVFISRIDSLKKWLK